MLSDLKLAGRQLLKSPGFTLTALLTLAIGIGATTAIFTLIHAVLLKSLPVTKPEELYRIGDKVHCCVYGGYVQGEEFSIFSYDLYKQFRDHTEAFLDLAAFQGGSTGLGVRRAGSQQAAELRHGEFVSGNYFRTFGIRPWVGRVLTESDDREGAPPVAVMSYRTWQHNYGGDSSVVGASFQMNDKSFVLVGIAPPGFFGANLKSQGSPDFWMPLADEPLLKETSSLLKQVNTNWLDLIGRVRPGTNPKALEAQLKLELRQWQMSHLADMGNQEKEEMPNQVLHLTPGGAGVTAMRQEYQEGLRLLLVAAGCVLLIACANLANILVARCLATKQQTSVRMALGASRSRLVSKALVESVTLGLLGGAAGLVVAYAGTTMILRIAFSGAESYVPIQAAPSWPVLLFALAVSVLTGICFGVAPAWLTSSADPVEALRGANRSMAAKTSLPQKALVVAQAALSLVLVSAAVMLAESLRNLEHQNFGFETKDRYVVSIDPHLARYREEKLEALYNRIQERFGQIPGVRSVAAALYAPMSGDNWNNSIRILGRAEPHAADDNTARFVRITPGYFEVIGAQIVKGRPITEDDTPSSRHVAVINEKFAKKFFKQEDPLGQHFGANRAKHAGDYEIVGVASDMRYTSDDAKHSAEPMYFMPESQTVANEDPEDITGETRSHYLHHIVLWAPGSPPNLETQVRRALTGIDPNLVIEQMENYEAMLRSEFSQERLIAHLTLLFGAIALVLAGVGLYGVTAYTVEQRTNEIGIRMALGADRLSVLKMVLRGAFLLVGVGLLIGVPVAIAAGDAISNQLFAVRSWDPLILTPAAFLLGLAALLATTVPSQRAARLEPMEALRNE